MGVLTGGDSQYFSINLNPGSALGLGPPVEVNTDNGVKVTVKNQAGILNNIFIIPAGTLGKNFNDELKIVRETADNSVKTIVKAANDVQATYAKAWRDVGDQAKRSFIDVIDAGKAVGNFIGSELSDQYALLQKASNQVLQGKIVDAIWSTSINQYHNTENNLFTATQQSGVLDMAVSSAASFYGGPAGAAAYAAWKTLKSTGDINLAFRTGLLAAIQQQGGMIVNGMPTGTVSEVVKKAAIAGAAGGLAVAVAGGDEAAITDAFLKSSGNVLIQDAREKVNDIVSKNPVAADVAQTVGCISARNFSCLADTPYVKEQSGKLIDQAVPALSELKARADEISGKWTALKNDAELQASNAMTSIPKLIDSDAMPLLNNSIVLTWTLGKTIDLKKGIPTVMITAVGENVPFISTASYAGTVKATK